jgi:trk system potassium uptake protein TrkA
MRIIIAGAGDVGFHLAELLSYESHDIILIDNNQDVLDYAATHLDVLALAGDSSSIDVLKKSNVERADLVLAVTTSEKNNLMTAILAKKMGARQTIARVSNEEYLVPEQREMFTTLGIDSLISPRRLAALEIQRLVNQCSFTDVFEFENGKMSVLGLTINGYSSLLNRPLADINWDTLNTGCRPMAILRGHKTIIPRGQTTMQLNDHVYFISRTTDTSKLEEVLGKKRITIGNIMIIGGTGLAFDTAKLLEKDYNVTLVSPNKERCKFLAEHLSDTLVINGEASNIDLLEEEGLNRMDAFIALSPNSETNIITSLTAKNHGVFKTIAQVENKEYVHISQNIGVDTLINKKLIAANNIFRFVRKGRIEAIASLNGVDAEIIEFSIHRENQVTRKPLKDLHFPLQALVGGVIRGGEALIPDGNFQLQLHDKVIVFALPEAIAKVERLFR